MTDKPIEFVRMIVPMLVCLDGASEIEFLKAAFGAVELGRRSGDADAVIHATLSIDGNLVMIHGESPGLESRAPQPDGSSPVVIYIYLPDVDGATGRAVAHGARILTPITDTFWGDRMARILDPSGHVWNVASRPIAAAPAEK
jgi:PhnB protein